MIGGTLWEHLAPKVRALTLNITSEHTAFCIHIIIHSV